MPERLFRIAMERHRAGMIDLAASGYRAAACQAPDYADCWHLLGVTAHQAANHHPAVDLIERALLLRSDFAAYHDNLGLALGALGRWDEALAAHRRAVQRAPSTAKFHSHCGIVLHEQGRADAAVDAQRRALVLAPDFAMAHANLAAALLEAETPAAALRAGKRSAYLRADYAKAHCNVGLALAELGRWEEAEISLRLSLSLDPTSDAANGNLGLVLADLKGPESAIALYERALRILAQSAPSLTNLSLALCRNGTLAQARMAARAALCLRPEFAPAHCSHGNILKEIGHIGAAAGAYRNAITLRPDDLAFRGNLLFATYNLDHWSGAAILDETLDQMAALPEPARVFARDPDPERKLRIGIVSGDFRSHSVSYFLPALLSGRDREKFTCFAYSSFALRDAKTDRLQGLFDHWHPIFGLDDKAAEALILADGIDMLIDLSGHSAHNRLGVFARRPAPLQVTWLGYPGSTGVPAMDIRLVDKLSDPEITADRLASEFLWRLEDGFLCYAPPDCAPDIAAPPCLTGAPVTFGSFNNPAKLSDKTLALWAALLKDHPGSRLLLKGKPFGDALAKEFLLRRFAALDIAADRLRLVPWSPSESAHLALYHEVDIALDPFPYNGTTTSCEALWMGVPLLTLAGERHSARVGMSILHQLGRREWIAEDGADLLRIARDLIDNPEQLAKMRLDQRRKMARSPLCDGPAFARKFEAALRAMWREWCAGANFGGCRKKRPIP